MVEIRNRGDKRRGGAHTEINESLPMEEKIVKNRNQMSSQLRK